jgi:type I restriction enzyme R subunit
MNEAETRAEHIDPALAAAGWGVVEGSRIRREYPITLGRWKARGQARQAADGRLCAGIPQRQAGGGGGQGMGQGADRRRGAGQGLRRQAGASLSPTPATGKASTASTCTPASKAKLAAFPTPDELWNRTFATEHAWRDRFAAVPFEDKGGFFQGRYYQDIAIERVLAAVAKGASASC